MELIKAFKGLSGKPYYYIIDHNCCKVLKLEADGRIMISAAFKYTYEKYLNEFKKDRYWHTSFLDILVVTGWSKQKLQDFIRSFRTLEYCEGTVWPRDFEERENGTSTGLWDSDAESSWL